MRLIYRFYAVAALCIAASAAAWGNVRLHSTIGNHMVIQQNSVFDIHGKADPGENVKVKCSWAKGTMSVKAGEDSLWSVPVNVPEGSFDTQWIEVRGKDRIFLDDVLIGDVWLCSGQSNMEMPMRGFPSQPVANSLPEIMSSATHKNLRLFNVGHKYSYTPLTECSGEWMRPDPSTVPFFSAVAYMFGSRLSDILDVPVGIIVSSYGGSRIESWLSKEVISMLKPEEYLAKADKGYRDPCTLYNAMIVPILKTPVKGVVWLQGESNRKDAEYYAKKLTAMMRLWREDWSSPELPFIICQIAPSPYNGPGELGAARLREAQYEAASADSHAYIVGTSDIGSRKFIHFPMKKTVAERVLASAIVNVYGYEGIPGSGPVFDSVEYTGGKAIVKFRYADRGLTPSDQEIQCFELAGKDGIYHPAKARIGKKDRSTVEVTSEEVPEPCFVRFAFSNWHCINLYNCEGLPAIPFRTDSIEYR